MLLNFMDFYTLFSSRFQKQPFKTLYKTGVLKSSSKLTGKHLRRSLIFKVAGFHLLTCNFFKKDTPAQVFPCKTSEFLKTLFLQTTSGRLFLQSDQNPWKTIIERLQKM